MRAGTREPCKDLCDVPCFTDQLMYDYKADHFVSPKRDEEASPHARAAFDWVRRLLGDSWTLTKEEQKIVDLIASELPSGPHVSGLQLRYKLRKQYGINEDGWNYYIERLQPRHVFKINGETDYWRLTVRASLLPLRARLPTVRIDDGALRLDTSGPYRDTEDLAVPESLVVLRTTLAAIVTDGMRLPAATAKRGARRMP